MKKVFVIFLVSILVFAVPVYAKSNPYKKYHTMTGTKMRNCAWYLWNVVKEETGIELPTMKGYVNTWYDQAKKMGFEVGTVPRSNSIIVWEWSKYGHVGYVKEVGKTGKSFTAYESEKSCYEPTKLQQEYRKCFYSNNCVSYDPIHSEGDISEYLTEACLKCEELNKEAKTIPCEFTAVNLKSGSTYKREDLYEIYPNRYSFADSRQNQSLYGFSWEIIGFIYLDKIPTVSSTKKTTKKTTTLEKTTEFIQTTTSEKTTSSTEEFSQMKDITTYKYESTTTHKKNISSSDNKTINKDIITIVIICTVIFIIIALILKYKK